MNTGMRYSFGRSKKFDITIASIGATWVKLEENFILNNTPSSVEIYVNGILNVSYSKAKKDNIYAINLQKDTSYEIYVVIENIVSSNVLNVKTLLAIDKIATYENTIALYGLDEISGNAIDQIQGLNSISINGSVTRGEPGFFDKCYLFNGGNVNFGSPNLLDLDPQGSWSILLWIYRQGQGTLANKGGSIRQYHFYVANNGALGGIAGKTGSGAYFSIEAYAPSNSWSQVGMINKNGIIKFSLNGKLFNDEALAGTGKSGDPVLLGQRTGGFSYAGKLDYTSFHNEALNQGKLSDLYNNGLGLLK